MLLIGLRTSNCIVEDANACYPQCMYLCEEDHIWRPFGMLPLFTELLQSILCPCQRSLDSSLYKQSTVRAYAYLNKRCKRSRQHGEAILEAENGVSPLERIRKPNPVGSSRARNPSSALSLSDHSNPKQKIRQNNQHTKVSPG